MASTTGSEWRLFSLTGQRSSAFKGGRRFLIQISSRDHGPKRSVYTTVDEISPIKEGVE